MQINISPPSKLIPIFTTDKRYIVLKGGRGSAKSHTIAEFLLVQGLQARKRILCAREIQNSIKDSVLKLLSDKIQSLGLDWFYKVQENTITGRNGTEFMFKGLYRNLDNIKSTEGIDYCWIEEAQSVSRQSLSVLIPTIRKENSQIIFTYNPTNEEDPVHIDYGTANREDTLSIEINYSDNPYFPDVLRSELEYDKSVDYDRYLHVWEGKTVKHSSAQVFYGKWVVEDFERYQNDLKIWPSEFEQIFYYGADWGFSEDPTALVRCFVKDRVLYIDYEAYGNRIDIDRTPELFLQVPGAERSKIIADSARPETISYMNKNGFQIVPAKKGKGSVEDGIQKIRGFEKVIIHPRCKNTIQEFRNYQYKVDRLTGNISTVLEDRNNHIIDALRYALEGISRVSTINRVAGI